MFKCKCMGRCTCTRGVPAVTALRPDLPDPVWVETRTGAFMFPRFSLCPPAPPPVLQAVSFLRRLAFATRKRSRAVSRAFPTTLTSCRRAARRVPSSPPRRSLLLPVPSPFPFPSPRGDGAVRGGSPGWWGAGYVLLADCGRSGRRGRLQGRGLAVTSVDQGGTGTSAGSAGSSGAMGEASGAPRDAASDAPSEGASERLSKGSSVRASVAASSASRSRRAVSRRHVRLAVVATGLAGALVLTGCSGDSDSGDDSTPSAGASSSADADPDGGTGGGTGGTDETGGSATSSAPAGELEEAGSPRSTARPWR